MADDHRYVEHVHLVPEWKMLTNEKCFRMPSKVYTSEVKWNGRLHPPALDRNILLFPISFEANLFQLCALIYCSTVPCIRTFTARDCIFRCVCVSVCVLCVNKFDLVSTPKYLNAHDYTLNMT